MAGMERMNWIKVIFSSSFIRVIPTIRASDSIKKNIFPKKT